MEKLEAVWDATSNFFGGIAQGIERSITSMFGSSNARYIKKLQPKVDAINALASKYEAMSDERLREQTTEFRKRLASGETLDDLLVEAFAVCREASQRILGMRHYDVQLLGGMVLHSGSIAEMVTGEGKTLVATLPAYLNALDGKGVHVVTVNDYLARRDMEWMGPLFMGLGLTVAAIQSGMDSDARQKAYACDITYGTNNEFGFDYLRDNMRPAARGDNRYPKNMQQAQGPLNYAIVDEVDNILVDEARTPLIISGPAHDDVTKYARADQIARQLKQGEHFEVKEKEHTVHMTEEGVRQAEKLAGVESFYTAGNMEWPHLIDNSLKAHNLYKRDVNYIVQNGEVVIVDEFTGRLMPGRNWSDGLHQAVEAKEGVRIKEENQTLATITLQNFFKLYRKISGMTGTAMTEAGEFWKIYKLDVIAIPTNRDMQRKNFTDVIYLTEKDKFAAIANEIELYHKWDQIEVRGGELHVGTVKEEKPAELTFIPRGQKDSLKIPRDSIVWWQKPGRPILVGTVSIEKSERLSELLTKRGVQHAVLNAKHHQREAEIIAQAGRKGAVTIATNMAGRGTDIILGGNAETMAWAKLQDKYPTRLDVPNEEWDQLVEEIETAEGMKSESKEVHDMGGLHVIATERHEARRIDLQLRGRCGRQGDPGSSRFFLSLEDDLMRIFGGEWAKAMLTRMGMKEGEPIESRLVSRRVEGAQKKVEERNFEIRKNLLEYDEVMDEQRKRVYGYRQSILDGYPVKNLVLKMIDNSVDRHLETFLDPEYGTSSFAKWAGSILGVELHSRDFRGLDFDAARVLALDEAERHVEGQLLDAIEENLPEDEDPREWNWEALAKLANTRWNLSVRASDLKKIGRQQISESLIERAREVIMATDLSAGAPLLAPGFNIREACGWVHRKFGIQIDPAEVQDLDGDDFKQLVRQRAAAAYREKEAEFPVMAGLYRFTTTSDGQRRYDREKLVEWASKRFDVQLDVDDLRNRQRDEIRQFLVDHSKNHHSGSDEALAEVEQRLHEIFSRFDDDDESPTLAVVAKDTGVISSLRDWIRERLDYDISSDELARLDREQLFNRLRGAVEDRYRPEMQRMERALVLQLLDSAWKEHLLAMDHLRSSIGLRGYAQIDPKVEYKREGMRQFEEMWASVDERVTDLIFRMEHLDEGFIGSLWVESSATHDEPGSTALQAPTNDGGENIANQQERAIADSEGRNKIEPIRNRGAKIGRNEPCPCGSGKKFKNCCMRKQGAA